MQIKGGAGDTAGSVSGDYYRVLETLQVRVSNDPESRIIGELPPGEIIEIFERINVRFLLTVAPRLLPARVLLLVDVEWSRCMTARDLRHRRCGTSR